MAQETRVAPIQLNDDASRIMMNLGENLSRTFLQQKQVELENKRIAEQYRKDQYNKQFQLQSGIYSQINAAVKNQRSKEMFIPSIMQYATQANLMGQDIMQTQTRIDEMIGQAAQYGAKADAIDEQKKSFISSLTSEQRSNFNVAKFNAMVDGKAFFKQDPKTGQPIPKGTDEIDQNFDYVNDALDNPTEGHTLFRYGSGQTALSETLAKVKPKIEIVDETDQNGIVRSKNKVSVEYNPLVQTLDPKTRKPILKTDPFGLIDENVAGSLLGNRQVNADVTTDAMEFVSNYNEARAKGIPVDGLLAQENFTANEAKALGLPDRIDPNNKIVMNVIKRAFLTHTLNNVAGGKYAQANSNIIVYPPASLMQGGQSDVNKPIHPMDRIGEVVSGNPQFIKSQFKAVNGKTSYDVSDQFSAFKVYTDPDTGEMVAPDKVIYNSGRFHVYLNGKESKKSYDPVGFNDLINLVTPGVDYAKPTKVWGNPAKSNKKSGL